MARRPKPRTLSAAQRQAERVSGVPQKRKRVKANPRTRKAATRAEPAMQRALLDAVEAARKASNRSVLEQAVARRNIEGAVDALGWQSAGEPILRAGHAGAYSTAFNASALAEAEAVGAAYSVINNNALRAMEAAGARFVTEVGNGTRRELRSILVDMMNRGLSVRETSTLLQQRVGLTERLSRAVDNLGERLTERGWTATRVRAAQDRKARELLRYRTRTIATTEAQAAASAGARASWVEAATQGLIDVQTAEMEWVTSSAPCPAVCEPADGQRRKLGEFFELGDGSLVAGPPGHVNCLCTVDLIPNAGGDTE